MKRLEWTHRVTMSGSIVVVKERKGQLGNNEKRVRSHVRCDITPTAISGAGQLHLYKFQKKQIVRSIRHVAAPPLVIVRFTGTHHRHKSAAPLYNSAFIPHPCATWQIQFRCWTGDDLSPPMCGLLCLRHFLIKAQKKK